MRPGLSIIFFLINSILFAQTPKGIREERSDQQSTGINRAVVVGISDYKQIPSLNFAEKDAREFADFLKANKEWKIDSANCRLLTNEQAKAGDIITALEWVHEVSAKGDKFIFYFSGHGDVETKSDVNQGYLLAYDSPINNYITGALGVDYLRKLFSDIIEKGAKVLIFTDACRSGHLAGGNTGVQQTAANFNRQWKNEVKVLSSQPDELSFEGTQWGEGRGVFSFYLIKGMNGFADVNKDSIITINELEQYVGQQVSAATANKQQPIFEAASKYSEKIAYSDSFQMHRYAKWAGGENISLVSLKEKGFNSDKLTHKVLENWLALSQKSQLEKLQFMNPSDRYALTAMAMNELQEIINQTLIGKTLVTDSGYRKALILADQILMLNRESQPFFLDHIKNIKRYLLINKVCLFEDAIPLSTFNTFRAMLDTALNSEPGAAYLLCTKGVLFMTSSSYDSAIYYFQKAMESSPTWLMPAYYTGQAYEKLNQKTEAIRYYEKILAMDTAFRKFECAECFYMALGELYLDQKKYDKAEASYLSAIRLRENAPDIMESLVELFYISKQKEKKQHWIGRLQNLETDLYDKIITLSVLIQYHEFPKTIAREKLDSFQNLSLTDKELGAVFFAEGVYLESFKQPHASEAYEQAYSYDTLNYNYFRQALQSILTENRFEDALVLLDKYEHLFSLRKNLEISYMRAVALTYTKKEGEAFEIFRKLVAQNYISCKGLNEFKPLKNNAAVMAYLKSNCQ